MANFTLTRIPKKMWTVDIDGTTYLVPMAGSLSHDEAIQIKTAEGTYDFFRTYIGDAYGTLTTDEQNQVVLAWVADNRAAGTTPGE